MDGDTSMALCLAESLIERGGFDAVDQLERYVRWWREGHLSSNGSCFDVGIQTEQALASFECTRSDAPASRDPEKAGNGSIMRLAPVPLAFASEIDAAIHYSGRSSLTTHPAPRPVDACRYLGALIARAVCGAPKEEALGRGLLAVGSASP